MAPRISKTKSNSFTSGINFGEIIQSILGMFGFRQINICKSEDDSFYCKFMRWFMILISFIILLVIIGAIFYLISILYRSYSQKGGKSMGTRR